MKTALQRYTSLLANCSTFALATASNSGTPQVAVLIYGYNGVKEIYFYTKPEGRKYKHLLENSEVSAFLYDDNNYAQLHGFAELLNNNSAQSAAQLITAHSGKNGHSSNPSAQFFKITVDWINVRMTTGPDAVFEEISLSD